MVHLKILFNLFYSQIKFYSFWHHILTPYANLEYVPKHF